MANASKLDPAAIDAAVAKLPGWTVEDGALVRTWTFPDFVAAMKFVDAVANRAEAAQHHPDIDIRYNRVRLALTTHDAGGITGKDAEMATALSGMD